MLNTLKYIGLCLTAAALLAINVNMVYRTFFTKHINMSEYKKPVNVTNDDIRRYADSLFVHSDSLRIKEDDIMSNKRIIMDKSDTLGFAFIVYEPIPCGSCSDVNYLMIADKKYTIKYLIFLNNIVEGYKIFPVGEFKIYSNQYLSKNLKILELPESEDIKGLQKHIFYFKESVIKIMNR